MVVLSSSIRASARALPSSPRHIHATFAAAIENPPGRDSRLSQGNVGTPKHEHPGDPQDQSARSGQHIARGETQSASPYDAANPAGGKKANREGLTGNSEGVGFAEQVGSASSFGPKSGARPGLGEREESTPPGLFASLKSKLGLGTSADEVKQNRGGGGGVTGTGTLPTADRSGPERGHRSLHTSTDFYAESTSGRAPDASRKPKEKTNADQNAHLQHKSADVPDSGQGNASADPKLPSHQVNKDKSDNVDHQRRTFSTSSRRFAEDSNNTKHTADSYFKDVDNSPPSSDQTNQVDATSVGERVSRPNEPLTGPYSRAGSQSKAYETVDSVDKYDVPPSDGPEKDQKLRYGNVSSDGSQTSKPDEGPEGASAGGRKPEGR